MAADVTHGRRHHHVGVVVGHLVVGLTDHVEIGRTVNMVCAHQVTIADGCSSSAGRCLSTATDPWQAGTCALVWGA
jgi:acetyltransferase-like isoleucine patch superfamily enzyme